MPSHCRENSELSKELGQLKSKMGEENQRYKSLEEHLTAKGNEFDALKKEHNDALLKKEATSDRKLVELYPLSFFLSLYLNYMVF